MSLTATNIQPHYSVSSRLQRVQQTIVSLHIFKYVDVLKEKNDFFVFFKSHGKLTL